MQKQNSNVTRVLSLKLQKIAQVLKETILTETGEELCFTLMVFAPERVQYISTAARADSIEQIEKMLDYWKRGLPDIPAHDIN